MGLARPYMLSITSCRENPEVAFPARSSLSTSSSRSTACFPCLRIHRANFGSVASSASAKSLRLHMSLWKGQYAFWHFTEQKYAEWQREHLPKPSVAPQFAHSFASSVSGVCIAAMVEKQKGWKA